MKTRFDRMAPVILAAVVIALAGCSSETTKPKEPGAPALPPSESLSLDLGFFSERQARSASGNETRFNFANAQLRAAVINLAVAVVVTPPALALDAAVHSVPSPQQDGSWIWTYTFVRGQEDVRLQLRGAPGPDQMLWQMRVTAPSADPPLDRVLWFEGTTRRTGGGEWTLHDLALPGAPAVLEVDYQLATHGDRFLTFTNVKAESPELGDRLTYSEDGADASIDFDDVSAGEEWFIEWDTGTGAGSLQVPGYRDGERSCWDENQNDSACPAS